MTNGLLQKRVDRKYYPIHQCKKSRKSFSYYSENKENLFQHLNSKANKTYAAAEYFNADPSFMKQATNQKYDRLDGGGGGVEETFYDCFPFESDQENQSAKQENLQIFEVINAIKNPKEFKSLLKQMAFTSNVLYRTFRQAYSRTKKNKQKVTQTSCNTCDKAYKEFGDLFYRGYRNPLEVINIEVPPSKQNYLEDVRYESWPKGRHKKNKSPSYQKFPVQEEHPCGFNTTCNENGYGKNEKICSICLGCLDEDDVLYCNKCCQAIFKTEIKNKNPTDATNQQTNFPKCFSETPTCLKETNLCFNYDEGLQNLDFCDRCAVLREEIISPPRTEEKIQIDSKTEVNEKSSQTCQQENYSKKDKAINLDTSAKINQPPVKQTLNLNPVCVTIPLKLQIDSQNCQSRFIETEIVMEAFSGSQSKTTTLTQKPESTQKYTSLDLNTQLPKILTQANKTENIQKRSCSDIFYSCISSSGIIQPEETQNLRGEMALNEILEILRKRRTSLPESYLPSVATATKPLEEPKSETKGTQISLADDSVKAKISEPKVFSGKTGSTQTEPKTKRTQKTAVPPIQLKAQQLRSDLLQEVRAVLGQTSPTAALKALLEGKRFSLPADLRAKEISAAIQARYSLPSNYSVIPSSTASPSPLRPITTTTFAGSHPTTHKKPVLPPKPTLTPKPIAFQTETVQTEASSLKPSHHAKRSEMRNEIQAELKELLEPNPSKAQPIYNPEARDEILLDLHKLFHPKKAGTLPKQLSQENALQDIRYLLETEIDKAASTYQPPKTPESQDSILQSIRHILNPKFLQKPRKRKYTKDTEEKILEDLQILLTPRSEKANENQEIRSSVLHDLRFMLETGQESPKRPLRLSPIEPTEALNTDPISSRALQVRQQRQQKPPNEIRDSLIADLRYLIDNTLPFQGNAGTSLEESLSTARQAAKNIPTRQKTPAKTNKSQTAISSETSLSDN